MTTIRTFIAIELSDEVRQAMGRLQNHLKTLVPPRTVRWSTLPNIHLTLHFLGDTPIADLDKVTAVVQQAAEKVAPFELSLGGLGCFPNTRRPRVIWIGLPEKSEPLLALHRTLGEGLRTAIDFSPDSRPYAPHLTLGRVKNRIPARQMRQLSRVLQEEQTKVGQLANLNVSEISLIKSELKPTGAVYTQLSQGILTG